MAAAKKKRSKKAPAKQAASRKSAPKKRHKPKAKTGSAPDQAVAVLAEPVDEGRDSASGRFLPGCSGNKDGRRKGTVNISTRIREALLTATDSGLTVAEVVANRVAAAVLKDPAKHFRILEWIEEREFGKSPMSILLQQQQDQGPKVIDQDAVVRAKALDDYLITLEPAQRAATVSVLADLETAIPGFMGFTEA